MKALHGELAVHDMLTRANDAPYQLCRSSTYRLCAGPYQCVPANIAKV
ncbi:hypothetical protein [Mycetohabitans rhizoxinica]|jgi:hypothetical protein